MFSQDEIFRYQRHFSVAKIGIKGQQRLKKASVLCIGAGGIGSPASLYLAAAGVGRLGVVDFDHVELSNLQRQVLFDENDCGQAKGDVAERKLSALNKNIEVTTIKKKLNIKNAEEIIRPFDIVVGGSDNYETRYLVGDVCAKLNKPLISASIFQFSGQLLVFNNEEGPCYRCLYPKAPPAGLIPNCAEAGVLGTVPGVLGTLAATEAIKQILDLPEKLNNQLLRINLLAMEMKKYSVEVRKNCPCCQQDQTLEQLFNKMEALGEPLPAITVDTLAEWRKSQKPHLLIDVRQEWEREISKIDNDLHVLVEDFEYAQISKSAPIVVYCRSGVRSANAVQKLKQLGYEDVYNLKGGVIDWVKLVEPDKKLY